MPKFSDQSQRRLQGVDLRLVRICEKVVEAYDISILEGRRTPERQRQLYAEGKTRTLNSKHLTGLAVDVAPYPIDWDDERRFIYMAGHMMMAAADIGARLRWGGNWNEDGILIVDQSFDDLVHFELV